MKNHLPKPIQLIPFTTMNCTFFDVLILSPPLSIMFAAFIAFFITAGKEPSQSMAALLTILVMGFISFDLFKNFRSSSSPSDPKTNNVKFLCVSILVFIFSIVFVIIAASGLVSESIWLFICDASLILWLFLIHRQRKMYHAHRALPDDVPDLDPSLSQVPPDDQLDPVDSSLPDAEFDNPLDDPMEPFSSDSVPDPAMDGDLEDAIKYTIDSEISDPLGT